MSTDEKLPVELSRTLREVLNTQQRVLLEGRFPNAFPRGHAMTTIESKDPVLVIDGVGEIRGHEVCIGIDHGSPEGDRPVITFNGVELFGSTREEVIDDARRKGFHAEACDLPPHMRPLPAPKRVRWNGDDLKHSGKNRAQRRAAKRGTS